MRNVALVFFFLFLIASVSWASTSVIVSLQNETNETLSIIACQNSKGEFGQVPPNSIAANSFGGWTAHSDSSFDWTFGSCQYEIGVSLGAALFEWNIPPVGYNEYTTTAPPPFTASHSSASGWHANVQFFLSRATDSEFIDE